MSRDITIKAIIKGAERYIVVWDDAHRSEALRVIGRWASNSELSFQWIDACKMAQRIREQEARP